VAEDAVWLQPVSDRHSRQQGHLQGICLILTFADRQFALFISDSLALHAYPKGGSGNNREFAGKAGSAPSRHSVPSKLLTVIQELLNASQKWITILGYLRGQLIHRAAVGDRYRSLLQIRL
jgi:hypothetical protein